ncbi:unnamed protein product [Schistosoma margrebowiei]|uniref:Uncharacterized protein n=1 Tax=Schistosoma margrebowiei TaxID=48269 RepID=A0A183LE75_9TREM|nr:unnamed protein product [Schistosoma margrebowiei]
MKTSTSEGKHGIQWTSRMHLDDLDFADYLALLSHTQQQMQEKTTSVVATSAAVGLNIHKRKCKILQYNTICNNRITLDGEDLERCKNLDIFGQHQFYWMGWKLGELRKISFRRYKCLFTVVYAKYFGYVDQTLSATTFYGRKQTITDPNGGINQEETIEVDRTHIEEITQLSHETSPQSESSRSK